MSKSNNNLRIVTHVIAGVIVGFFLVSDLFFSKKLNVWSFGETILTITVFYIHALVILPRLFKTKTTVKYIVFTFGIFAIWAVLSAIFKIASLPDYVYVFTRILNDGPAFGTNMDGLYEAKFLNAILLFGVSFLYGVLMLNEKNKYKLLIKLIFDKQPTELVLHIAILFVLSVTLYFANILFSNMIFACFVLFYSHLLLTSSVLLKEKRLMIFFAITLIEILLFAVFLSHFTNITTVFIISAGISILTISSSYAVVRHQIKTNEFAFTQKDTELKQLKSKINPHFLFNALNTLYSFAIKENAEKTASNIKKFSNLIRFTLSDIEKDFIPIEKEIKYIKDYIDIQLARCPVKQNVKLDFENYVGYSIAPMLLIPFVENSFKHGINPMEESVLMINLDCNSETIYFECINSLNKQNKSDIENDGFGIGIENIKSRLGLIYPNKHKLTIIEEENLFKVKLEINDKSYSC